MLHTWANSDGTQKIENTGPLNTKRMETIDEEFLDASLKFIDKAVSDKKPFFVWFNSTRMHIFTHLKKESNGKTGFGLYPDGMVSTALTDPQLSTGKYVVLSDPKHNFGFQNVAPVVS